MKGDQVVIISTLVISISIFFRLGFELGRTDNGLKSEIIQKYKSGKIVCTEFNDEFICRDLNDKPTPKH